MSSGSRRPLPPSLFTLLLRLLRAPGAVGKAKKVAERSRVLCASGSFRAMAIRSWEGHKAASEEDAPRNRKRRLRRRRPPDAAGQSAAETGPALLIGEL